MSVRAYRINKIEENQNPSFNLWHDTALLDFFDDGEMYDARNQDGGGYIEVSVEKLKQAIKKRKTLKLESYIIDALKMDIAWAEKKGNEFVMYSCY